MIALRGLLKRQQQQENTSSDQKPSWKWEGVWTFGAAVPPDDGEKQSNNTNCLPFAYEWQETAEAAALPLVAETKADESQPVSESAATDKGASSATCQKSLQVETKPPELASKPSDTKADVTKSTPAAQGSDVATTNVSQGKADATESAQPPTADSSAGDTGCISKSGQKRPAPIDTSMDESDHSNDSAVKAVLPTDPSFTEASKKNENCPPSGVWKGCFETVASRKGEPNVKIEESFSLILNATPPKDALSAFQISNENQSADKLVEGHVHVRGKGKNTYGTFEIIGSLDPATLTVNIQRRYIPALKSTTSTPRRFRSRSIDPITDRPTRKRQMTWKKRAADEEFPADPAPSRRASAGGVPSLARRSSANNRPSPVFSKPRVDNRKPRRSAPRMVNNTNGTGPKLPSVADPEQARWRAAHFLYYQPKQQQQVADGEGASNSHSEQGAMSVCYEGDTMGTRRHGRGICRYNNGLLYEGEWYADKEHGSGKILEGDRSRVIYEGQFEKGRINGFGVYHYYEEDPKSKVVSVSSYKGEFKETLRHGDGVYTLADGSVYNGSFREDMFCGRGVFTWPDKSVYDGEWKDGKRHGMGVLKASDGFIYDGMWVNNAMEGRGMATYPDGQQYNGLFSRGRREGRGTIIFTNGAVYEGRFRDDAIDGQGTMKMGRTMRVPRSSSLGSGGGDDKKEDYMIPLSFQSDMGHIHRRAGFTVMGE